MTRFYERTAYAVWELTLRCNLACRHCGSRAGDARSAELSTAEALDVVSQLADVGVTEVTLIGGEAFVRRDWLVIASAIVDRGMRCTMTTGGFGISSRLAERIARAGITLVSVSIDGLEPVHDYLRGRPGSWRKALEAVHALSDAGLVVVCNTQLNRLSAPELPALYLKLRASAIRGWQVQITAPMGRAADDPTILFQPPEIIDLHQVLARIARRAEDDGMEFLPANNVGYFSPYERLFRSHGHPWGFWQGPSEGLSVIGIESDGWVKADVTLPSSPFRAGNLRQQSLRDIVENSDRMGFNLDVDGPEGTAHLWGFCRQCEFAKLCRGGDTWTPFVFFGRRGNHPYCYHRAAVLRDRGRREQLDLVSAAPGEPFDYGRFSLTEQSMSDPWPADDALRFSAQDVRWPADWQDSHAESEISDRPKDQLIAPSGLRPPVVSATPDAPRPLLPRSGWNNSFAFLRALAEARAALEIREAQQHHVR